MSMADVDICVCIFLRGCAPDTANNDSNLVRHSKQRQ